MAHISGSSLYAAWKNSFKLRQQERRFYAWISTLTRTKCSTIKHPAQTALLVFMALAAFVLAFVQPNFGTKWMGVYFTTSSLYGALAYALS